MPYTVRKDDRCPTSKPWALIKNDGDKLLGCHPTKAKALAQQSAVGLHTHEDEEVTVADNPKTLAAMLAAGNRDAVVEAGAIEAPRAGQPDRIPVTIIKAGWSKNGRYYPAEVLKRDGAATWPAGTLSFVDHATEQEDEQRPSGTMTRLAGYLVGDAAWDESKQALVGELRTFTPWRDAAADWAGSGMVGMSIRAWADAKPGTVEGQSGDIVSRLYGGGSTTVDIVTRAAAGGKLGVLESVQAKAVAEARNVGAWLESRLHLALTQLGDDMYGDGRLTREERLTLSSAIGDGLTAYTARVEADAPQLYERDIWDYPEPPGPAQADEAVVRGVVAEASAEEIRRALTAALMASYSTTRTPSYICVHDYDAGKAVVWYAQYPKDGECTTYEQGYTLGDGGRVTLADQRVPVVARTVYDPAPNDASAATVRAGEDSPSTGGQPVAEEVQPGPAVPPNPSEEESMTAPLPGTSPGNQGGAGEPARNPHSEALRESHEAQLAATKRADEATKRAEAAELRVRVAEATDAARGQVAEAIAKSPLAKAGASHSRIIERVVSAREVWLGEDGKVDSAKLGTTIQATISGEATYLAQAAEQLYGVGQVRGLGGSTGEGLAEGDFEKQVAEIFQRTGLDEKTAAAAARGRN